MDEQSRRNLDLAIKHLQNEDLYLFAGAGLSKLSDIPLWHELANECIDAYDKAPSRDKNRVADYKMVAETRTIDVFSVMINEPLSKRAILDVFNKYFCETRCHALHKQLIKLPFQGYITINYDKCFEDACKVVENRNALIQNGWFCYPPHKNSTRVQCDTEKIGQNGSFLLHMHGCFFHEGESDLESIMLTRHQYNKFYEEQKMKDILKFLSSKHLLMIGTGLVGDPYFMNELYKIRDPNNDTTLSRRSPWFIIVHKDKNGIVATIDSQLYDLHPIFYDGNISEGLINIVSEIERKTSPLSTLNIIEDNDTPSREVK